MSGWAPPSDVWLLLIQVCLLNVPGGSPLEISSGK